MRKKVIILTILISLLIAGGIFWWWQSGEELRELNKNLPEGIRVIKTFSGEYEIINKKDDYKINWPKKKLGNVFYEEIQDLEEIMPPYFPEEIKNLFISRTDLVLGEYSILPELRIDCFNLKNNIDLRKILEALKKSPFANKKMGLEKIGDIEVLIVKDGQENYSFQINSKFYNIACEEENLCENILKTSKWSL